MVLVTGGAGYIGSRTVRTLRERGEAVMVIDSLESGHREAGGDAPLDMGDIATDAPLGQIFAEWAFDAMIHFAAYKAPDESMADPGRYSANNVAGTLALLRGATRAGGRRFVLSPCSAYGTPETLPVSKTSAMRPESPYAASKKLTPG
jgi:UDP-glucose 4-epimerase